MSDIRVTFVLPEGAQDENEASEMMVQAYESCKQLVDNISWTKEDELFEKEFGKLDYVVFENFEGKDFDKLIKSKCARIIGPLAVSVCLMEGKPIPNFQWPILNVAMYGCQITCSQLTKTDKELIKNRVHLMGGLYTGSFTSSITHLICDGTKSEKYMLAAERGVKLMLPSWIDYMFETSQTININADDTNILIKHRCPPFHKLIICTTGITTSKEKAKFSQLITSNGGKMVAKLNLAETDVLMCYGTAGTTSEKYKAARKTRLSCVTPDWIYDSIEKGYALPYENYNVKAVTSTPTKEGENVDPNFSSISHISGINALQQTPINETINRTEITTPNVSANVLLSNKRKVYEDLVEKIDIKKVKNAGHFLDGCSVFVIGFSAEKREKLNKIVNLSGATRFDEFSDRVTHVIVGDTSSSEMNLFRASEVHCTLVSVQWLIDSIDQQKPAAEDRYLVTQKDLAEELPPENIGSPLKKKAMILLKTPNIRNEEKEKKCIQEPERTSEDVLTQQYLKNNTEKEDTLAMLLRDQQFGSSKELSPAEEFNLRTRSLQNKNPIRQENNQTLEFKPHETSTQVSQVTSDMSENDTDVVPIFQDLVFHLIGFSEEDTEAYKECIIGVAGTVADESFKGVADYALVPIFNPPENLPKVREVVNDLWMLQSIEEECLCDIQYYHRPLTLPSSSPLKDCVVTISLYSGQERHFLKSIIEGLGGVFQEQFSRKNISAKNVLASTHLVTPEASGKKYEAALKWNLPVINKNWLLECLKTGTKVDVEEFSITDRTITDDSKKSNTSSNSAEPKPSKDPSEMQKPDTSENRTSSNSRNDVFTPVKTKNTSKDIMVTPVQQIYKINQKDTPETCSQITPINKILQDAINDKVLPTPPSPKTYYPWDPKTPDTPIGAFIRPNPSPRLRKEMQKYINSFPDFVPPKRRTSTPLSELKKRLRDKVMGIGEFSQNSQCTSQSNLEELREENESKKRRVEVDERFGDPDPKNSESEPTIKNVVVQQKLQELQEMVKANGSSSATRRSSKMFEPTSNPPGIVTTNNEIQSQVCTVGWDYGESEAQTPSRKLFLLSGIDFSLREHLTNQLKKLGAMVSESNTYDKSCTHLICSKPARNEKFLACMASGKWILHYSYVENCVKAGRFLDEEEFEFGNPKAMKNIPFSEKDSSIHFWRKELNRRGYGAFNDMRAIVVAEKREPIANVIEAGGGVVLHVTPPFEDSIHATHCLLEVKMVRDFSVYVPLAQQGIKCINTLYINDYLYRNNKDESDYIVPYFTKYY